MASKTKRINLTVNKEVYDKASKIIGKLGISVSSATSLFLNQVVIQDELPFELSAHSKLKKKKKPFP